MTEFRVVVTGSRTWADYGAIYRRLAELASAQHGDQRIVVIHGGARGADMLADMAAKELGYETRPYPVTDADWKLMGKRAGMERNGYMLREERPQVVLAFWKDESPGTGDCIAQALEMGLYVEIHNELMEA